jgi:hypothetical protein
MKMVGYIGEDSGMHYVYSNVDNVWSVSQYSSEGLCKQKMMEMKASAMIIIFEDFLILDSQVEDLGKNVVSYKELRKRIQDYITWALEHQGISPQKVSENGFKMRKVMAQMIKMITPENEKRGELLFLFKNVTLLFEQPYNC